MRSKAADLGSLCMRQAEDLFGALLPVHLLAKAPGQRQRVFPLTVIFWTFLCQIFASASCRGGVASIQVLLSQTGKALCSPSTAAYCKARLRIPIRLLLRMQRHLVAGLCPRRQPRTFVVDGTTLSLPDSSANQARWPQSRSQRPGCGFPILRVVGLFDLSTGAWIAAAKGSFRSHERNLCRRLWRHLQPGDTVVADSGFCCWFTFALLSRRGIRVVMRNHGLRKADPHALKLAKDDRLECWKKPPVKPAWLDQATYDALPDRMQVRLVRVASSQNAGYRTPELHLATTVLDPTELSVRHAGDLYLRRWRVELFLDDLKTTLGMAVLRTQSPAMIHRELLFHQLAYNLLRALIGGSGAADAGSFKGAVDRLNRWMPHLTSAPARRRKRLVVDLLETIADDLLPERPYRREPRVLKRRPKPFQLMNKPRSEMMEIPHRSRYKKPLS
jgi:hypothetical protein